MSRYSEDGLQLIAQIAAGDLALAKAGESKAAANVLRVIAMIVAGGNALPEPLSSFLAQRLRVCATDPFDARIFTRTAAQARSDGHYWRMFNETREAWRSIQRAPRGRKTQAKQDAAAAIGIEVRELHKRFRRFGFAG